MSGFAFAYRLHGGAATHRSLIINDGYTVSEGELVCASTNGTINVATSANGPAQIWGVCTGTVAETSASYADVIIDEDAIYAVDDSTARYAGDTLSLDSSQGLVTAVASNDGSLLVVANTATTDPTYVMIRQGKHVFNTTTGSRLV